MKVVYSPEHLNHSPVFETYEGIISAYAETPDRIETIKAAMEADGHDIIPPRSFPEDYLREVHRGTYVDFIRKQSDAISESGELQRNPSYHASDLYAPLTAGTYRAARKAVDVALTTAAEVEEGSEAYGLSRPPGHHASCQHSGGYCYFNNASVAANQLSDSGTVAILDIDFHHGNGTQDIFYDRGDVLYTSLHADPTSNYPYTFGWPNETGRGEGEGKNLNIVLPKDTDARAYLRGLRHAIKAIEAFAPDFLVVSLGFDTYHKDPIAGFDLRIGDYEQIGETISELALPTTLIQEGGYYVPDLGRMASSFFTGYLGARR